MNTLNAFPYDFMGVIFGGGLICALVWHFIRQRLQKSKGWLALFCLLFAATITPTCFPFFGWTVAPAVLVTAVLCHGSNLVFGLMYGALPILLVAGLSFAALFRRFKHDAVA